MDSHTKTPYERVVRLLRNHINLTRNQTSMTEELLNLIIERENPIILGTESSRSPPSYNASISTYRQSIEPSPAPSQRSLRQQSQTIADGNEQGQLCVRCFMRWKNLIETGNMEIPPCTFAVSGRRKKCEYCSNRRSKCNLVSRRKSQISYIIATRTKPVSISSGLLEWLKALQSGTTENEKRSAWQRFQEVYWEASIRIKQLRLEPDDKKRLAQKQNRAREKGKMVERDHREGYEDS